MIATSTVKQAHSWNRDIYDFYLEPEWCSKRLFDEELFVGNIADIACGTGRILDAAKAAGYETIGCDLVDRGARENHKFLSMDFRQAVFDIDNIVSNPPFKDAREFAEFTLRRAKKKIALLLPTIWLHGSARAKWLERTPLRRVLIMSPRPSMPPGEYVLSGQKVGGGTKDFSWFVWVQNYDGRPEIMHLQRDRS